MRNNPTTLARPARVGLQLCLASHPEHPELTCTRIGDHEQHCCDEPAEQAWDTRGRTVGCIQRYNHSAEKGLAGKS